MEQLSEFPFSGIVGQEIAKRALLLYAVNPAIGGVLINGSRGSGKSQLLHAASLLIPDRLKISIPVNITADRLLGSFDMTAAIDRGRLVRSPGLLETADGQLLLADHMNLVPEALIREIVYTCSSGWVHLQREGMSKIRRSRFMLLAAMDSGDGVPSPSLLDHFGFCVTLAELADPKDRAEIIRRRLLFEQDPDAFRNRCQRQEDALRLQIQAAGQLIPYMEVTAEMIQLASSIAVEAGIASARAELSLVEGAKAAAAWDGRTKVTKEDIRKIAEYVLPHRMREAVEKTHASCGPPLEPDAGVQTNPLADRTNFSHAPAQHCDHGDERTNPNETGGAFNQGRTEMPGEEEPNDSQSVFNDRMDEQVLFPDETYRIEPLKWNMKRKLEYEGSGKRYESRTLQKRGRSVGAVYPNRKQRTDVAFDATIRAAAPYQLIRTKKDGVAFAIELDDLRLKKRENRVGSTLLFVVDASGSMLARKRMAAVKGGILSLLRDSYVKRDRIGMIAFRREEAELVLPVTRSIDTASKHLRDIPTGGRTPLAAGIHLAYKVLQAEKRRNHDTIPTLIFVTDGRANQSPSGLSAHSDIWNECLEAASRIRLAGISSLVIDTEQGFVKFGRSKELAEALGAEYRVLEHLNEAGFADAVRINIGWVR
ncbi:magnesium chelatase [Paenibacillus ihbetae]|uniref:Magnesium chelatase n=1 Tax=Paenibacillus ihbetae TaxID=1870820 RepID=A0A1B2E5K9_9BACL|nr:VWA domain-containing protein [Paenibacillus ihbetae]ANY75246.1 magnesium chelatase [Paenibacillus ihbetae]